jgi:Flp pilus assembly protein TadD
MFSHEGYKAVRTTGFALRNIFRTSLARWLLIIATGSAATSCSGTLGSIADKVANVLPGQTSPSAPKTTAKTSAELLHSGDAAREKGDLDAAVTGYAAAIAVDPTSVEAELRLGSVDLARKDETGAITAYQAAQKLDPKNPEAAFRLGEIALTHGQAQDASDQFTIALESRKDDPKLYNAMGVALSMQHHYASAKENYDKGLALEPDYPALRNNYGLMQLASGDLQGALATFSALVASPQASDRYRLNRALVELALGQTDAALADAPGTDEAGLRQTLAIYLPSAPDEVRTTVDNTDTAPSNADGAKSPLPAVHLAVDRPAATPVVADTTTASIKPVAGLPPPASP